MSLNPWLLIVIVALVAAILGAELLVLRLPHRVRVRPGAWAPPAEQERLTRILARNPSYDERTGLTSDRELARWFEDNRP
ncbi:hypothetical protein [uncultured Friedmanniella sp.]|uniref:hypothetical protein n=1 Tax=uncultured Friedmanniella sp. TaxID=335381 RepID=UPI0035C9E1AA